MKIIGLTGTMGSGKTTVSRMLRSRGYTVYDTDEMSRELTAKGSPVLDLIAERFGACMIGDDGELDRRKLAGVVFSDPAEREALEDIVTAKVVEKVREIIAGIRSAEGEKCDEISERNAVFFDVPLLFESGLSRDMDECWCVTADDDTRIRRIMKRDGISREEILARFRNQMPQSIKTELADVVIDNSGSIIDLEEHLTKLLDVLI